MENQYKNANLYTPTAPTHYGIRSKYFIPIRKKDDSGTYIDPPEYTKTLIWTHAFLSARTSGAFLTDEPVDAGMFATAMANIQTAFAMPMFTADGADATTGLASHAKLLRSRLQSLSSELKTLRAACEAAGAETMNTFNKTQLKHIPLDSNAPIQDEFVQFDELDTGNASGSYRGSIVGATLLSGVPKFAVADVLMPAEDLSQLTLDWTPTHTGPRVSGGAFNTPIYNEEGETIESTEAWCLYKPTGAAYQVPSNQATTIATWGGDAVEGLLVSQYTGDLLLRNFPV